MMNENDIANRYRDGLDRKDVDDGQRVWWTNVEEQNRCFDKLLLMTKQLVGSLSGLVVHDAGCGLGDLAPRIVADGAVYVGTDALAESVNLARARHAGCEFRICNLLRDTPPAADVVIACGTFSGYDELRTAVMLHRLWCATRKALAFTSWWNVREPADLAAEVALVQKAVGRFIHLNGSARMQDVGFVPNTAAFVLMR